MNILKKIMILIQNNEKYLTTHLTKLIIFIITIFICVKCEMNKLNLKNCIKKCFFIYINY